MRPADCPVEETLLGFEVVVVVVGGLANVVLLTTIVEEEFLTFAWSVNDGERAYVPSSELLLLLLLSSSNISVSNIVAGQLRFRVAADADTSRAVSSIANVSSVFRRASAREALRLGAFALNVLRNRSGAGSFE